MKCTFCRQKMQRRNVQHHWAVHKNEFPIHPQNTPMSKMAVPDLRNQSMILLRRGTKKHLSTHRGPMTTSRSKRNVGLCWTDCLRNL